MENLVNKIKKYLETGDNKKIMNNLFIILTLGIILLIITNIFIEDKDNKISTDFETNDDKNVLETIEADYGVLLEKKLEDILSQLKGVGKVRVMITLEDTIEKVPAFNTTKNNEITNEIDAHGGTREIVRDDMTIQVVTSGEGGLVILKEIKPTVKGVIVIAQGAENLEIKEMLYEAVKTVLGISGNKVEVYSSK
ncbi:stage III sporulation protein AG [Keratinibaculum paraultunense]|uniref:Stage III sporulation protein AG n=1 Tax=Keratinibaculum paraultunense TaxID=1278232 RepID=A0A4R3L053_9FIRM|nr:sporulation stage III protein AG [Keratinibaculum paraultunense]QQY80612.1 sporulation stage III protein AG [Keratinibaculum paraultunense]TCS91342.1 stage III sporulation protein AG [Keratinibaculum paraultunense]